jgi:hypothetical protein
MATRTRSTMDYLGACRRMVRAAGRRAAEAEEPELAGLLELQVEVHAAIDQAVLGQRARGRSWAWIGHAAGTTRSAAFQRWGKLEHPAA